MKTRITLAVLGAVFIGIGLYNLFTTITFPQLTNLAVWLIGVVVVHDFVIAPAIIAVGFVLSRTVSARIRPIVQGGFIVAAVLTAISIPVVLGLGRYPGNPSLLPLDYGRNLVIILITVAVVTVILAGIRLARDARASDNDT